MDVDRFLAGDLLVSEHEKFGFQIVAARDIPLPDDGIPLLLALFFGKLVRKTEEKKGDSKRVILEKTRYSWGYDSHYDLDTRDNWIGKINHASPESGKINVAIEDFKLWLLKPLAKGDALWIDYGVEYWVSQITGFDLETEWTKIPQSHEYFIKLHWHTDDYSTHLNAKLHDLPIKTQWELLTSKDTK